MILNRKENAEKYLLLANNNSVLFEEKLHSEIHNFQIEKGWNFLPHQNSEDVSNLSIIKELNKKLDTEIIPYYNEEYKFVDALYNNYKIDFKCFFNSDRSNFSKHVILNFFKNFDITFVMYNGSTNFYEYKYLKANSENLEIYIPKNDILIDYLVNNTETVYTSICEKISSKKELDEIISYNNSIEVKNKILKFLLDKKNIFIPLNGEFYIKYSKVKNKNLSIGFNELDELKNNNIEGVLFIQSFNPEIFKYKQIGVVALKKILQSKKNKDSKFWIIDEHYIFF